MEQKQKTTFKAFNLSLFVSIIFMLTIVLPIGYKILGGKNIYINTENRYLSKMPGWSWNPSAIAKFPQNFQYFFNDNFGLRDAMIRIRHQIMLNIFKTSPTPTRVVLGQDGWMYSIEKNDFEDFLGLNPVPEEKLLSLENEINQKLQPENNKNIKFYFLIAPDKETVYPEYLPGYEKGLDTQRRFRNFYQRLQLDNGIKAINVLDALISSKTEGKVYYQTDSHWNYFGAYFAIEEIVKQMSGDFPSLAPIPLTFYSVQESVINNLDLSTILGFPEIEETDISLTPPESLVVKRTEIREGIRSYTSNRTDQPALLLFADSFGEYMPMQLAGHFSKVILVQYADDFDPYIKEFQPDIVLWETVERTFFTAEERPKWNYWRDKILELINH
ncbi:MAG TPA: DHHW family protein [Longilinea sp.]|nr:DHHW family protein [Longilinea sp.]